MCLTISIRLFRRFSSRFLGETVNSENLSQVVHEEKWWTTSMLIAVVSYAIFRIYCLYVDKLIGRQDYGGYGGILWTRAHLLTQLKTYAATMPEFFGLLLFCLCSTCFF